MFFSFKFVSSGQISPIPSTFLFVCQTMNIKNIVAAFRGMYVSPAKHSYVWLPRKYDYQESVTTGQTDGQTDAGQSDPYVPLCFAGDTKTIAIVPVLWLLLWWWCWWLVWMMLSLPSSKEKNFNHTFSDNLIDSCFSNLVAAGEVRCHWQLLFISKLKKKKKFFILLWLDCGLWPLMHISKLEHTFDSAGLRYKAQVPLVITNY